MAQKTNTRVTFDMPTIDYKKLKLFAAYYGTSMKEILVGLVHNGLETYQECKLDHTPNAVTKKAIANIEAEKGLEEVATVDELFKKLSK